LKKKKLNIVFFIDYDIDTGLGHLNRCLHLIKFIKSAKITFISKKKIKVNGIKNINDSFNKIINFKKNYDIAVIDSYKFSSKDEKQLKKKCKKIITIDDLNNRKYYSDILINYNPRNSIKNYKKNVLKKTSLLIGNNYNFILFKNFKKRTTKKKINILIYLGTKNKSKLIKKILDKINQNEEIVNNIVILSKYKFKYEKLKLNFIYSQDKIFINKIIKNSDICFLSTGVIVYEALSYGKIIFGKAISLNQLDNYKFLTRKKIIHKLNDFETLKLKKYNKSLDKNFFKNSFKTSIFKLLFSPIIDNKKKEIHLEFFSNNYLKNIYELQTKYYRKNYLNPSTFSFKKHLKYYARETKDYSKNTFIIKQGNNFVGYIKTHDKLKTTDISIAIKKKYQKRGIATRLLKFLRHNEFFKKEPSATIKKDNIKSISAFKKAGIKRLKLFK
jgi:spore coat polysaccharide biosynthesis predicted glycosyltransferase SpsG/ribosomal protein S18 acetylase RimI-like enzyme